MHDWIQVEQHQRPPGCIAMPLLASTEMHRHANKAVPVGFTGEIGPKQMWERACPRCAARAALGLETTEKPSPGTSNRKPLLQP
ncbi:hypothetical protein [Pseudomonas sp. 382]|uniref:hypothetical protein n=1 Tax=Pseudomonas sp. 382 TaxID=1751969 RepID=UPI0013046CAD|nr:hypothetical protein [Pseudomonas sp. 382]